MTKLQKKWFLLVNFITISRIIGSIALFPIYFCIGHIAAGIMLTLLFVTDWIDGYLARKHNVCTFFGSLLDTICDKLIIIVSCSLLCFLNPYFICSIVFEVLILLICTINLTQNNKAKSPPIGRIKMFVLCVCVIIGFFICDKDSNLVNLLVILPAAIFEIIIIIDYSSKLFKNKIVFKKEKTYKSKKDIKKMLFSPDFYEKHKDSKGLLNNIYKDEK